MNERTPISAIKGIGEKTEKLFEKLGVYTVKDLISHFPRGYEYYNKAASIGELEEGRVQTVTGVIYGRAKVSQNRRTPVTSVFVKDSSGMLKVIWFQMPFLKNTLVSGDVITLRGQIVRTKTGFVMEHPEIFYPSEKYQEKLHTLQPLYPLTAGLTNRTVAKAVKQALRELHLSGETLPQDLRMKYHLAEYNYALRGIHFPKDKEALYRARERLVFEEFLEFIVSLRKFRSANEKNRNHYLMGHGEEIAAFIEALPYELTSAQKKVYEEVEKDMESPHSMSRLIQGDVGSGKTIIAVLALMKAGLSGYQGAMMAPTEVLARQHYESVTELFSNYQIPLRTELLTGSMTVREKRAAYDRISSGEVQVIIGTHALIQENVEFRNLALVVTDEQHRFGVRQRETFFKKGEVPHVLVMSATPIPRTLAMILYGDLDISVIDELPSDRLPVKNCVVDTSYRDSAYRFIKRQVEKGRQCYIVCPMVEESKELEAENVIDYSAMLKEELGEGIAVDYLHGKMKQIEKDRVMERFYRNEVQVLVSTTVIEVGINVPNAAVMMIENAERFGLAQLHQLRGRVGRGRHQSYCIFMSGSKDQKIKKRLEILNETNDGFKIASEDMKLRGPGDFFGIRQSGFMDFKLGDIYQDANLLEKANEAADWLLKTENEWIQKLEKQERTSSVIL